MSKLSNHKTPFAALKIKEFKFLMLGRFFFIMALRMLGTLVGWWIYELTNDPFAIGLIGLSEVIPAFCLSLYAGHVIDISEKRKLLLRGVMAYIFCLLFLFWLSATKGGYAYFSNQQLSYIIYGVIFFTGIFRAFTGPTFGTLVGSVLPKEVLQNGITWNQTTWLSASVIGHASVGFLIAGLGIHGAMYFIVTLAFIGCFFLLQLNKHLPLLNKHKTQAWQSVKQGLQFVFKTKEVLGALSLDLFAVLFGGVVAMIPVFAKDILQVGAKGLGWLNAASDLGTILSVALLTFYPLKNNQGKKLLWAVAGFGACILVFAVSKNFYLSFAALLVSGLLDGVSVVVRGTIVQLKTPNEMRGRVMSVNSMFINSSNELGQFESGVAAKLLGTIPSVIFGGCATIFIVLFCWFKVPKLKNMKY